MKINILNPDNRILNGVKELESELFSADGSISIKLNKSDKFVIGYSDDVFTIDYFKENNVYYALSYIFGLVNGGKLKNGFKKEFKRSIEDLCFMIDCSRNAVPKVETIKKFIRHLSLMGYDSLMLYTEDTYQVKEYPYFGYLRNPYTKEEIHEVDEYCRMFNIELIPCIQTLAHFNTLLRHIGYEDLFDINDILLAGSDKTYDFIEAMIRSLRESFSSNKIHIGMDEAHYAGRGKYLDKNGYTPRFDLMCGHLSKVIDICKKYGFTEPKMWSDMFVAVAQNSHQETKVDVSSKDLVPKDVELVYWDYYSMDEKHYEDSIKLHQNLDNEIGFAGANWKWLGFTPDNRFSFVALKESMTAVNNCKIRNYIVTAWGDNGAECSLFACLPSMLYASSAMYGNYELDEDYMNQFKAISGMDFNDFMTIDLLNRTTRNDDPYERSSANKYLLYNDPLLGTLDTTITRDVTSIYNEHVSKIEDALKRTGKWEYIFKSQYELGKVLSIKAELGVKLRKAYKENDRNELSELKENISVLLGYIDSFKRTYRSQWNKENKPNGIDVFDLRIGALIERLNVTEEKLENYLDGTNDSIPELEEELLDFLGNGTRFKEDYNQCEFRWRRMTSVNVND